LYFNDIIDGIVNGFRLTNRRQSDIKNVEVDNYKSATDIACKHLVERQILEEIAEGRYVITQYKPNIISALGAILKTR